MSNNDRVVQGLCIWAYTYCRSVLAFYDELAKWYEVPLQVFLAKPRGLSRIGLGWSEDEFQHLDICVIGNDVKKAKKILLKNRNSNHLFTGYQNHAAYQYAMNCACDEKISYGILSEAPLNMFSPSLKRGLKTVYLNYYLPLRLKKFTKYADFIINYSGDATKGLVRLGWSSDKVIAAGYFPPPLEGTQFRPRDDTHHSDFHILCTGIQTWHRGQDVLIEAAKLLKKWNLKFRITMTQEGTQHKALSEQAEAHALPVNFVGKVPMEQLTQMLETCSCYVGTGRCEPWGIRVNDALHCGAPLVVSSGMGAVKIVNDYGCGMSFHQEDHIDLAWKLRELMENRLGYDRVAGSTLTASKAYQPQAAALRIGRVLDANFDDWQKKESRLIP